MRLKTFGLAVALGLTVLLSLALDARAEMSAQASVKLGPRPYFLVNRLQDGELKSKLEACANGPFKPTAFSIGHRGAALMFPEHTKESYLAAARMGAGIIECDATFTKDRQLVYRHGQCDLHTTTNILAVPDLAAKCSASFAPASGDKPASAKCCTSDITLAEFKMLKGKMDAADTSATTVEAYMKGTPPWRSDLYDHPGTLMTHAESIALIKSQGRGFTPELKSPSVDMPYEGD